MLNLLQNSDFIALNQQLKNDHPKNNITLLMEQLRPQGFSADFSGLSRLLQGMESLIHPDDFLKNPMMKTCIGGAPPQKKRG